MATIFTLFSISVDYDDRSDHYEDEDVLINAQIQLDIEKTLHESEVRNLKAQVEELRKTNYADASSLEKKVDNVARAVEILQSQFHTASANDQRLLVANKQLTEQLSSTHSRIAELEKLLKDAEQKAKATIESLADEARKAQQNLAAEKLQASLTRAEADALLTSALGEPK